MLLGKVDTREEGNKDAGDLHFVVEEHDHLYGRAGHHGEDKEDDQCSTCKPHFQDVGKQQSHDAQYCGWSRGLGELATRQLEIMRSLDGDSQ